MKKSQIFLGASAFLLAIAGALATKASFKNISHLAGYTISGRCHQLGNRVLTTVAQGNKAHTSLNVKTLYTAQVISGVTKCGKILYTQPVN
jgi:hypothetical protein